MCSKHGEKFGRRNATQLKSYSGFTLVELLVVISIIALLLAILMPALNKARNQARITMCMANNKQIGNLVQCYMAENNGRPPILTALGTYTDVPVEYTSMSIALRNYSAKINLPASMNTQSTWNEALMNEYVARYMPKYFQCPFIRGQSAKSSVIGRVTIGSQTFSTCAYQGARECYGYPFFTNLYKGCVMYPNHPLGAPNGTFKFAMLTWFDPDSTNNGQIMANWTAAAKKIRPNQWDRHAKKLRASLGESVVASCMQGEFYGFQNWIMNYGSHSKGKQGGCTALMGDMHIEWVPGTQIGWF